MDPIVASSEITLDARYFRVHLAKSSVLAYPLCGRSKSEGDSRSLVTMKRVHVSAERAERNHSRK
jgi:hypothetical protein